MKIGFKFLLFLFLFIPSVCVAGDDEVPALIDRADSKPYTDTGAQLPVFRQQLAKLIDINDDLLLLVDKQNLLLTGQESLISTLSSRFNEMSFLLQFLAVLLSLSWGSMLYISFVQRR